MSTAHLLATGACFWSSSDPCTLNCRHLCVTVCFMPVQVDIVAIRYSVALCDHCSCRKLARDLLRDAESFTCHLLGPRSRKHGRAHRCKMDTTPLSTVSAREPAELRKQTSFGRMLGRVWMNPRKLLHKKTNACMKY